jgi:hypothetical protein
MACVTRATAVTRWHRRILWSAGIVAASVITCASLLVSGAFLPPPANVVTKQAASNDSGHSIDEIDHASWDELLQRYVNGVGLLDYSRWKSSPADVAALDEYLFMLSQADLKIDASREAKLAFWINAYNALTVRGILRDYPTAGSQSALTRLEANIQLPLGKSTISLDQIENDVLRPLNEPQIHFAIVCGARGCPRLMNRAYTARGVTAQLDDNAKQFFADPTKFAMSGEFEVQLSPILQWFADDFGKTPTDVLNTIVPYMPDELRPKLLGQPNMRIRYLEYDRSLNDQAVADQPPLPPETVTGNEPDTSK